jgi:Domain of unknown function (DUF4864)
VLKGEQPKEAIMLSWLSPYALPLALVAPSAVDSAPRDAGGVEARAVVQSQIDAFRRGDAKGAYALTSSAIKDSVPNAGSFLEIVRSQYAALLRPRKVEFGPLIILGDEAAQNLSLIDDQGGVWAVVYVLTRQPNGAWAIDDYLMVNSDGTES